MEHADASAEFERRLSEIKRAVSGDLKALGCVRTSKNVWRLDAPEIVVRLAFDASQAEIGLLQVTVEFAPPPARPFIEHAWVLLSRYSGREDLYSLDSDGEQEAVIRDVREKAAPLLTRWDSFDDLWRDLLHARFKDDPVHDRRDKYAALSALEIAHFRGLGEERVAEALSYIASRDWTFRADRVQDSICHAFPELISDS